MDKFVLINGVERAQIGSFIESQAKDPQGNPAWLLRKNGAFILSSEFVKQGSIQMLKVTAP
ncbi:hypothetical protein ALO87_200112 [Pseudomonas syringae pv. apii]|uniref:hypothetical protein n=1 Tax=Pseudomonas syringae group genomosp. 3 TaxID=251701 RepID=UPI0006E4BDB5|nr:hypothetical protein [Pseudomonas syringae group genomosp. 3]KPW35533.1 hypothetical protein ALO87_200112 [Pseudomonas syringae pv. apii]